MTETAQKPPLILWLHWGFIAAAIGWLTLSLTIGYRFGWWYAPLGVGLGLLLAGLGLMARDAVASWALAYFKALGGKDALSGGKDALSRETERR